MPSESSVVLTVDVAVLCPNADGNGGWEILLIRRDTEPFRDAWALPGGKVDPGETPEAAACRELAEETGLALERYDLSPLAWYATPDRDPRGRYVSLSYACLLPERPDVRGRDDAAEARWWPTQADALPALAFDHREAVTAVCRLAPRTDPPELSLRTPTPADTGAIIELHHRALDAVGANAGPGPWDDDLENISAHYLDSGGDFVIGSLGGFLVAMGALRPTPDGAGEIKRMRVHPRWQGRGLGRRLLETLEKRAIELRYRRLVLDTTEDQHAALALYQRSGYRRTGQGTVAGLPSLFFEKLL